MMNFNHIEFQPLRVFNRCVMLFNIKEDEGQAAAEEYLKQFSKDEKIEMWNMYLIVKKLGAEEVRRQIMLKMPLQQEEEEKTE